MGISLKTRNASITKAKLQGVQKERKDKKLLLFHLIKFPFEGNKITIF
jgi:hypothetical protein